MMARSAVLVVLVSAMPSCGITQRDGNDSAADFAPEREDAIVACRRQSACVEDPSSAGSEISEELSLKLTGEFAPDQAGELTGVAFDGTWIWVATFSPDYTGESTVYNLYLGAYDPVAFARTQLFSYQADSNLGSWHLFGNRLVFDGSDLYLLHDFRLLVVDRATGQWGDEYFLPDQRRPLYGATFNGDEFLLLRDNFVEYFALSTKPFELDEFEHGLGVNRVASYRYSGIVHREGASWITVARLPQSGDASITIFPDSGGSAITMDNPLNLTQIDNLGPDHFVAATIDDGIKIVEIVQE